MVFLFGRVYPATYVKHTGKTIKAQDCTDKAFAGGNKNTVF
jgi:hypothetical protein